MKSMTCLWLDCQVSWRIWLVSDIQDLTESCPSVSKFEWEHLSLHTSSIWQALIKDLASIFGPPSTARISALLARLELEEWRPGSFLEIIWIMLILVKIWILYLDILQPMYMMEITWLLPFSSLFWEAAPAMESSVAVEGWNNQSLIIRGCSHITSAKMGGSCH